MEAAPLPREPDNLLGTLLGGKYRIEGVLGRGGTGRVYRAIQEPLGRTVAVKVLRPDLPEDEARLFEIRFLREASQAGALQHPNVVTVHDYGRTDDGTCYIAMELLRGRSLKDVLKDGPMPARRAMDIFDQMLRGLRAAHVAGLVHRDVKPGNIILLPGDEGRDYLKILDFGLVKDSQAVDAAVLSDESSTPGHVSLSGLEEPTSESTVTRHGIFLGTPHYVAPEQARGMRVDGRADLYSAGVVLYRMLTGKLPFYDRNPSLMALAHVQQPYPPMAERAPEVVVPSELEALVRRCMEKVPEQRYADADAVLADLTQVRRTLFAEPSFPPGSVVSGDSLSNGGLQVLRPLPAMVEEGSSRRWIAAAIAFFVVVAMGGAWIVHGLSRGPGEIALVETPAVVAVPVAEQAPTVAAVATPAPALAAPPPVASAPLPAPAAHVASNPKHEPVAVHETPAVEAAPAAPAPEPAVAASAAPLPSPVVTPSRSSGDVTADGVAFTQAQAASAVAWVNRASKDALYAAGVAPGPAKIIVDNRPFADISAFAATYGIGPKTVAAVRDAAR